MSPQDPIPDIKHFQNMTFQIQGQGDGWSSNLEIVYDFLLTHTPFVPC